MYPEQYILKQHFKCQVNCEVVILLPFLYFLFELNRQVNCMPKKVIFRIIIYLRIR